MHLLVQGEHMKRMLFVTILTGLLVGCAHRAPHVDLSSYEAGFKDGCQSGIWYDLSKVKVKDYHRAMNDRGYFHGWDEGFSECRYNIYYQKYKKEKREWKWLHNCKKRPHKAK